MQAEVIAIASRNRGDVEMTRKALDLEFVLVPGPNADLMKQYAAYNANKSVALPVTFIIDKNGVIRWKYVGKNEFDRPKVRNILRELQHLQ